MSETVDCNEVFFLSVIQSCTQMSRQTSRQSEQPITAASSLIIDGIWQLSGYDAVRCRPPYVRCASRARGCVCSPDWCVRWYEYEIVVFDREISIWQWSTVTTSSCPSVRHLADCTMY